MSYKPHDHKQEMNEFSQVYVLHISPSWVPYGRHQAKDQSQSEGCSWPTPCTCFKTMICCSIIQCNKIHTWSAPVWTLWYVAQLFNVTRFIPDLNKNTGGDSPELNPHWRWKTFILMKKEKANLLGRGSGPGCGKGSSSQETPEKRFKKQADSTKNLEKPARVCSWLCQAILYRQGFLPHKSTRQSVVEDTLVGRC